MLELSPLRAVIVIATAVQCYNYVMLGVFKRRQRLPWLFVLLCFCIVEAYFAITVDLFMLLFVALNLIGIVSFWKGGK